MTLSGQIERVTDAQRALQEKIDCYQTDKEILLEELEKYGLILNRSVKVRDITLAWLIMTLRGQIERVTESITGED